MTSRLFRAIALLLVLLTPIGVRAAGAQDRLCDSSFENCRAPLLELIRNETRRIDAAFWFMTDARYSNEIIKRWQEGVDVRIIIDPRANDAHSGNAAILQQLRDAGIPMRQKHSSGILHWKMMLFDAQNRMEFSAANYSPYGFVPVEPYVDYEDEVIYFVDGIESPTIINAFRTRFEDLWTDTSRYSNYANISTPLSRHYPIHDKDPELNFPPFESYRNRAIGHYNAETEAIDVTMFRITDRTHTDAIINAAMRGVPVRLLTDKTEYRNAARLWHAWNVERMYMAGLAAKRAGLPGIDVRLDAHENVMHQKSIQLHGQGLTIFGSSNWTSPSAGGSINTQEEHNYFTTRLPFYTWFRDQFERKWNNTNPIGAIETEPFVPLPPDRATLAAPSNGASGLGSAVELVWDAGLWAHVYDIHLGTDPADLAPIAADVELGPSQSATDYRRYTVKGLNGGTTYYWRIVSKTMAQQTRTSATWSFTTGGSPSSQAGLPAPWSSLDIGTTLAGSATESAGTFTVQGAGADIWDTADGFHFVYQPVSGDATVTARVVSQQHTDVWAKAGVMMREALSADSPHASMFVSPSRGVSFQRRPWAGSLSASTTVGTASAPYWVRLVRQGHTFSAYASPDGTDWTLIGSDTIVMGETILVGLPVTSHDTGQLNTTTFDNVSFGTSSTTPGVTLVRHPYLQQVTSTGAIVAWATREPGPAEVRYWTGTEAETAAPATTTLFTATATGLAYDFYQHEARLDALAPSTTYNYEVVVGGLDATEGIDTLATAPPLGTGTVRFIAFGDSGTGSAAQRDLAFVMRTDTFDFALHTGDVVYGSTAGTGDASHQGLNDWFFGIYRDWLRARPLFPALGNHDSRATTNHGEAYLASFVLPENGLSATYPDHAERYYSFDYGPVHFVALDTELAFQDAARRAEQLAWLEADLASTTQPWKVAYLHRPPYSAGDHHGSDLAVREAFEPIFEQYGVQLVIAGHEHAYERTLPQRGAASAARGVVYLVTGGGGAPLYPAGVAEWTAFSAAAHHYVRAAADECTIVLEAVGLDGAVFDTSQLSICEPLDTTTPTVTIADPLEGAEVSGMATITVEAADDIAVAKVGLYLDGALVSTLFEAPYTFTWNTATAADGPHTLEARAYDAAGNSASSGLRTVQVSSDLPAPWQSTDVGAVGFAGSAGASDGTFTVTGAGADVWGTADAFHFLYQPLSGDGEIVARVSTVQNIHAWTKAGVMMRETLGAGSAHAFMLVSPGKGLAFQRRTATGGLSTHTSGGAGTAPRFVKLARSGNTFTASVSSDGVAWTVVGSDTIPMAGTIAVGLAVSSHDDRHLATATFDQVAITAGEPEPGDTTAPVTAITFPANGAEVSGAVTVTATADDEVGVTRVELWLDGALLATRTAAPYEFTWDTTAVTNGSHTLQTRAYDAADNIGSSGTITVQVTNGTDPGDTTPPVTAITFPANGAEVSGAVTVTATASDDVGVTRVELWLDAALLATRTAAPYEFTWDTTAVTNGSHTLQTRAYDAADNIGSSGTITVQVTNGTDPGDTTPPVTAITFPANGAEVSGAVTVTATASDDVGVTRVELWLDAALLATSTTAPYEFAWDTTAAADGSHTLQTRAYDAADNIGSSGTITVQVTNGTDPGGLPSPWVNADIGHVGATGSAQASGGTFVVDGAGADVWGTADAFHYVYRPLAGNGEIVARVVSVQNVDQWTKAGVMMRETLDAGSRHAFMLVSPGKGLAFQRRTSANGTSVHTAGGSGTAPAWVKLVRTDSLFSAYRSTDGVTWSLVGTSTIAMSDTILVGIAVSSHKEGILASASFDAIHVETTELPGGWSNQDIGAVGPAGSAGEAGGTFTVNGSGSDVWGTADAFHYTYRQLSGDGEIVARVATLQNTDKWAKAGVMMRETLDAGSAHAFALVSPGKGLAFQRRPTAGGESVHTSGGAGTAPRWMRLVRSGSSFSAYVSADGAAWTLIDSQTISMGSTIYVGLAVTSHDNSRLCAATFDMVSVSGS